MQHPHLLHIVSPVLLSHDEAFTTAREIVARQKK